VEKVTLLCGLSFLSSCFSKSRIAGATTYAVDRFSAALLSQRRTAIPAFNKSQRRFIKIASLVIDFEPKHD